MGVNLRSLISRFNHETRSALEASAGLCLSRTHYDVEIEHYLTKLLDATGASNRGEAIKLYIENIERWRADPRYREAMRARD